MKISRFIVIGFVLLHFFNPLHGLAEQNKLPEMGGKEPSKSPLNRRGFITTPPPAPGTLPPEALPPEKMPKLRPKNLPLNSYDQNSTSTKSNTESSRAFGFKTNSSQEESDDEESDVQEARDWVRQSRFHRLSFSALLGTVSFGENFYEKRFSALGNFYLFSIPLSVMGKNSFLHLELGPGFSITRLTLTQPSTSFTHFYLLTPFRFRFMHSVSKTVLVEMFAGGIFRFLEIDSRASADGGTRFPTSGNVLTPDGGLGLLVGLSSSFRMRLFASYLFVGGGLELLM